MEGTVFPTEKKCLFALSSYFKAISVIAVVEGTKESLVSLQPDVQQHNQPEQKSAEVSNVPTTVSETLTCRTCNIAFEDLPHYQAHYKSEWHRCDLVRARL
jgi:hypothetical protein